MIHQANYTHVPCSPPRQLVVALLRKEHQPDKETESTFDRYLPTHPECISHHWFELLELARHEGLESFLYQQLAEKNLLNFLPTPIQQLLVERHLLHQILITQRFNEYQSVYRKLGETGIESVPIKGIALIQSIYRLKSDRPFNDIDLLIRPEEIHQAARILELSGYQQDPFRTRWGAKPALFLNHHLPPFRKGHFTIELHYKLLPGNSEYFTQSFLASAIQHAGSDSARLPEKFHHAIFLAAHLDKHSLYGHYQYRLMRDLACLLGKENSNWDHASDQAGKFGLREVFDRIRGGYKELYLSDTASVKIPNKGFRPEINIRKYIKLFGKLPTWQIKLAWIADILFPSIQYIKMQYPRWNGIRLPFWYLYRIPGAICRLFSRHPEPKTLFIIFARCRDLIKTRPLP